VGVIVALDFVSLTGSDVIASAAWIQMHTVQNRHLVAALREKLDPGESEAIALALELNATLLLIDESDGSIVTTGPERSDYHERP
jgi:predicted nucleic acid-binding protein